MALHPRTMLLVCLLKRLEQEIALRVLRKLRQMGVTTIKIQGVLSGAANADQEDADATVEPPAPEEAATDSNPLMMN